jgi:arylsulfatase A-like enzyme
MSDEPAPPEADASRRRFAQDVGAAVLATVALTICEVVLATVRMPAALGAAEVMAFVAVAMLIGAGIGVLSGVVFALVLALAPSQRPRRRSAGLAVLGALAAVLADALLYTNLYPDAHALLGIAAVALVLAAAVAGLRGRWLAAVAAAGGLLALLAWPLVDVLLADHHALRHAVVARTGVLGRTVAWLWPVRRSDDGRCVWPPAAHQPGLALAPRASIVLVTIDAFRADHGGERLTETMPGTASRLRDAVRFDRAHAPAPRTTYSTYSMLTGRFPHRLGFVAATTDVDDHFHRLDDDDPIMLDPSKWKLRHRYPLGDATPTLAGMLGAAGWRTAAIVSDVSLLPEAGITREFEWVDTAPYLAVGQRDLGGETSETSTDAGIAFAHSVPDDIPLLMWLHYRDPHHPYTADPPVGADASATDRYASELRRVDRALDRLLAELESSGRLQHSIVIVTGDHGEEFHDHGGQFHGTGLYAELIRVPLSIWWPGATATVLDQPVSLTDLTPTLLDLVGVPPPGELDGQSFAALLAGEPWVERPLLAYNTSYTAAAQRQVAVIDGALKLIQDEGRGTLELFDELADPGDRHNLADERRDQLASMRCLLAASGALDD